MARLRRITPCLCFVQLALFCIGSPESFRHFELDRYDGVVDPSSTFASFLLAFQPSVPQHGRKHAASHSSPGAHRLQHVRLAGFGKPIEKTNKVSVKPKAQWDVFKSLSKNGASRHEVFCRADVKSKWMHVGDVAISKKTSVAAAVQLHKDLITQHAGRVSPKFIGATDLQIAYREADIEAEVEPTIFSNAAAAKPKEAGFLGQPEPSGFYKTRDSSDFRGTDTRNIKTKGRFMVMK